MPLTNPFVVKAHIALVILLLSFLVFPQIQGLYPPGFTGYTLADMPKTLLPYLLFLPNIVLYTFGIAMFASHTWSIGTEEQFYIIWPLLFRRFKNKLALMISIILFYLVMKHVFANMPAGKFAELIVFYWSEFPIDNMAIGGIFALIIYSKAAPFIKAKKFIFNRYVQIATYLTVVCSIVFRLTLPDIIFEYYCVLFGIIIANLAANERSIFSMETASLKYLGKISYGLYIYHPLMIAATMWLFRELGWTSNLLFYPLSLGATILISGLSYRYFESAFIKKKKEFSVVVSGDNSAEGKKDS